MRTYLRIATVAGVALAWAGLWLVWERWSSFSHSDTDTGFKLDGIEPFRYALLAVTVIAAVYVYRLWKAASIALTIGALVLLGLAVHVALTIVRDSSTFVDVAPGLGFWLSAAGAVVLIVASKPNAYAFGAGLIPLLVLVVWSGGSTRPQPGHVSLPVDKVIGTTMALDGDKLMIVPEGGFDVSTGSRNGAEPFLEAFDVSDITSGFADRVITMAAGHDNLYINLGNRAVMKLPAGGKPTLLAVGPLPPNQRTEPPRSAQRIADFYPSRMAVAPDGSLYVLSVEKVYRYDGKSFAPVTTPALNDPQDIAVDSQNRLYIADTGNGRVLRIGRDGTPEPLLGASAPDGCGARGLDEPASLDPTHCHAIEALAVDSKGNLFVSTSGLPRILALTTNGRFGVVAGTGVAGTGVGDGRAVSAQLGDVTNLAVGPDDDLYVGEFYRALRINDPVSGLDQKPTAAPRGPRNVCQALANWGGATLQSDLVTASNLPPLDELLAALKDVPGEDELKALLSKPYNRTQEHLEAGSSHTRDLLRAYGSEHCGLADGLYPLSAEQTKRFCTAYLREWAKVPDDAKRDAQAEPARKTAPLLPASILPPRAPKGPDWDAEILQTAKPMCAVPYRWTTSYVDAGGQ